MFELLGSALYHLFYLFGATSVGYVLLRLGYPEVRALDQRQKLFDSLLVGAGIYAVAFLVDALLGYSLSPPNGFAPLTVFLFCALGFFSFKFYAVLSRPNTMAVAVPTPQFVSNPRNVRKMRAIKQRVLTQVPASPGVRGVSGGNAPSGFFSGVKSFFDAKKADAGKGLPKAPKRELTEQEQAEYFADEVVPKGAQTPPKKEAGVRGHRRLYRRARAAGGDSEEMKAFLDAVQKQFVGGVKGSGKKKGKGDEDEFNFLVKDVYAELKQKPEEPKAGLGVDAPSERGKKEGGAAGRAGEDAGGISLSDLFGGPAPTSPQPEKQQEGGDLFAQLSLISGGGVPAQKKQADSQFVEVKRETGMACPYCGAKNTRVVYCPYCGTGFCANCATSLVPTPDAFVYTCPKCGEDVTVKKKS